MESSGQVSSAGALDDAPVFEPGQEYQFSGKADGAGMAMMLGIGLATAVAGSLVYAGIQAFITYASGGKQSILGYLGYLGIIGLAFLLPAAVVWGSRLGKVRHSMAVYGVLVLTGGLALYLSWLFWVRFTAGVWVSNPIDLVLAQVSGDNGVQNGFVMLLEAGLIVGATVYAGHVAWKSRLFCERCGLWTKDKKAGPFAPVTDPDKLVSALATGQGLKEMLVPSANLPSLGLKIDSCPQCNALHAVSITITMPKDVKKTKEFTKLEKDVEHTVVSSDTVSLLTAPPVPAAPAVPPVPPASL